MALMSDAAKHISGQIFGAGGYNLSVYSQPRPIHSYSRDGGWEADGIVAEVIFPNTIPPFYPEPSLKVQQPGANEGDLELRWTGLRAHNRWLADFCSMAPGGISAPARAGRWRSWR